MFAGDIAATVVSVDPRAQATARFQDHVAKTLGETSDTVWTPYGTHGKAPETVRAISGVRILFILKYSLHGIR